MYTTFEAFQENFKKYDRIPVYREIPGDLVTPVALLNIFSGHDHMFLLESANLDKTFSRYTFFGHSPSRIIEYGQGALRVTCRGKETVVDENPMEYVIRELREQSVARENTIGGFTGGYVGYIGYDMANHMGILRKNVREDGEHSSMVLYQADEFFVFDNFMGRLYVCISVPAEGDAGETYERAVLRTMAMATDLGSASRKMENSSSSLRQDCDFDEKTYIDAVEQLRGEIISGECIQTVLSNKREIVGRINPVSLYRLMRNINPSPYMFFIKNRGETLCGTSPEIHLRISDRTATLKPIAGTYRLGPGSAPDIVIRDLLADEKERAEHLMLLDLARNDLYTGCETDSVMVTSSFEPEVYSHLVHIVSEVQGKLRPDVAPLRLFCNSFPAGTVTGAPKVRAMELIDQYERSPRGFYAGCAGYFSYSGDLDTCIIIRSALVTPGAVILRSGAGIVYDSVPEKEMREVEVKLGALFEAVKQIPTLEDVNVFAH